MIPRWMEAPIQGTFACDCWVIELTYDVRKKKFISIYAFDILT